MWFSRPLTVRPRLLADVPFHAGLYKIARNLCEKGFQPSIAANAYRVTEEAPVYSVKAQEGVCASRTRVETLHSASEDLA